MRQRGWVLGLVLMLAGAAAGSGCAAKQGYRVGWSEAGPNDGGDAAVARLARAVERNPDDIGLRMELLDARFQASRRHYQEALRHLAAERHERAVEELESATQLDPSNRLAADELLSLRERGRAEAGERPRSGPAVPPPPGGDGTIAVDFRNQSLQKVLETLGKLAGANVVFDPDFRDRTVTVRLGGVTFQEALDQLTFANRLFYRVLDGDVPGTQPDPTPGPGGRGDR